jgi:hypothetical protein
MQPKPPTGIRKRTNPSPRPQKPKPLDGIDGQKEQRKEKNSAKNQGITPLKQVF